MLKRSHDHRYTPALDLAQLGARPPPDKKELVMPRPSFSGSEMILTFWSFLFEGRVAEESLEEREFHGRLRRYNQLNILVSAKIKPFRTTLAFYCLCWWFWFVFVFSCLCLYFCVCPPRCSAACVCVASAFVFRPRVAGRAKRGLACNAMGVVLRQFKKEK